MYIYSNDGQTQLAWVIVEGGLTLKLVSDGVMSKDGKDDPVQEYTYAGSGTFLGLATSANATTPTYSAPSSSGWSNGVTISNGTYYIVEDIPVTKYVSSNSLAELIAKTKQALNNKQDTLPTTTTAGQVLKSTSTAGTVEWGAVPSDSNKMDKANPTGTGSLSLNRAPNTTIGTNSVAIGFDVTASGTYSYSEGAGNTSTGTSSHAEGYNTTASNNYAHAEGTNTIASGNSSHAEGYSTTASGTNSHAEGNSTTASGTNSHAEGYGTKAQRKSQHTFGEYNVLDTTGTTTTRGDYVEIVGNGTSTSARSNARTLDWSGNEVLSGTLQTTGLKDGNNANYKLALPNMTSWTADKTIATKEYVDDIVGNIETLLTALNSGQGV